MVPGVENETFAVRTMNIGEAIFKVCFYSFSHLSCYLSNFGKNSPRQFVCVNGGFALFEIFPPLTGWLQTWKTWKAQGIWKIDSISGSTQGNLDF